MATPSPAHTSAEHLAWASQNETVFNAIRARWPDWAATVLFYTGLHEVQAFLLDNNHVPRNHAEREQLIKRYWRPTIWPPYEALKQLSEDARYECLMPTPAELNNAVLSLVQLRVAIAAERALMT